MFVGFNPYDSDEFPEEFQEFNPELPPDNIPIDENGNPVQAQGNQPLPLPAINTSSSEDDEEPNVACDPHEKSIHMSDLKSIRTALSLITKSPGGTLSNHLKRKRGLIILPLSAVAMLRKPCDKHVFNPPAIIYYPSKGPESAPHMQQFNEAIRLIYSIPH